MLADWRLDPWTAIVCLWAFGKITQALWILVFPSLNKDNDAYFISVLWRWNERIYLKHPRHNRDFTNTPVFPLSEDRGRGNGIMTQAGLQEKGQGSACPEPRAVFLNPGQASESTEVPCRSGNLWAHPPVKGPCGVNGLAWCLDDWGQPGWSPLAYRHESLIFPRQSPRRQRPSWWRRELER